MPAAENAAPYLLRLSRLLKARPLEKQAEALASRIATSRLSEAELAAVRQLLSSRRDVLDLAHQAAARPGCDFQRVWSKGAQLGFPE